MSAVSPRVLILGATGLLGSHLAARFPSSFQTLLPETRLDAMQPGAVRAALDAAHPDVVVNAIGAKGSADAATLSRVNSEFPLELASVCASIGARVVHISTDAVFSGVRGAYAETDSPDPADDYGRSKLAGELSGPHLTLRTSFFGRTSRGTGLIEWLAAQTTAAVDGIADYWFTGIEASLLADLIAAAIASNLSGVYHVGGDRMSKCDLLLAAAARLQLDLAVRPVMRGAVDRSLDSTRFFAALERPRPTLAQSIDALAPQGALSRR
jgi:dTDP-4-dehydrorhamnose reductase